VAQNPQAVRQLARPLARPTNLGRGAPTSRIAAPRTFHIDGPATVTITPR
jgi:hypothetical protein